MLVKIIIVVAAIIVAILAYAATRPDTFRIERSITIDAPPEKVFALLDDFRGWGQWSPWEAKDPNLQRTFSGPASGLGAVYAWVGNKDVGAGRMEIKEDAAPSKLLIQLDFIAPFKASNMAEFNLQSAGGKTTVNWAMYGNNIFIAKLMQVFMSMEKMVGPDFDAGLAKLKKAAEAG